MKDYEVFTAQLTLLKLFKQSSLSLSHSLSLPPPSLSRALSHTYVCCVGEGLRDTFQACFGAKQEGNVEDEEEAAAEEETVIRLTLRKDYDELMCTDQGRRKFERELLSDIAAVLKALVCVRVYCVCVMERESNER